MGGALGGAALAVGAGIASLAMWSAPRALGVAGGMAMPVATLPLLLAGLAGGLFVAGLAGAGATALAAAASGTQAAIVFAVLVAVPGWACCRLLLRSQPRVSGGADWTRPMTVLLWFSTVAAAALAGFGSMLTADPGGPQGVVHNFIEAWLGAVAPHLGAYGRMEWADAAAPWFAGVAVAALLLGLAVAMLVAFAALRPAAAARRPTPSLADQRAPLWLHAAALAAGIAALVVPGLWGYLALNAVPVLLVPAVVSAVATVHGRLAGLPLAPRIAAWAVLVGVPPLVAAAILFDIGEQLLALRRALAARRLREV
ncbi:MAG: hypothetical protein AB7N54_18440 [Alphaproteobacteria bacterium]